MNHRKGGKMKKDWTWYTGVLEYYSTCSSILYILHVRAILGKKAAQLPTRASGGAKNTKLDLLLGYCFFLRRTLNIRFLVCVPSCGYTESNCGQKGANLATCLFLWIYFCISKSRLDSSSSYIKVQLFLRQNTYSTVHYFLSKLHHCVIYIHWLTAWYLVHIDRLG